MTEEKLPRQSTKTERHLPFVAGKSPNRLRSW